MPDLPQASSSKIILLKALVCTPYIPPQYSAQYNGEQNCQGGCGGETGTKSMYLRSSALTMNWMAATVTSCQEGWQPM